VIKNNDTASRLWYRGKNIRIRRVASIPGGETIIDRSYKLPPEKFSDLSYNPADHPDLPNVFAKVIDEEKATQFAERWGLLGYNRLQDLGGAEPLAWVLYQAKTVKFILDLTEKLYGRRTNIEALVRFLRNENKKDTEFKYAKHSFIFGGYDLGIGTNRAQRSFFAPAGLSPDETQSLLNGEKASGGPKQIDDIMVKEFAQQIISVCVNGNTLNVRRVLNESDGKLVSSITYKALIEVIWHHVGNIVLQVQEGKEIRICDECQTPFLVRDGRQRFCPSPGTEGYSRNQSNCSLRQRQRKKRQKDKQQGGTL